IRWPAIEVRRQHRQRPAAMRSNGPGHAVSGYFAHRICYHGKRAIPDGSVDIAIAIRGFTAHRDESPSWMHAPRIVIHAGDLRIAANRLQTGSVQQIREVHLVLIICKIRSYLLGPEAVETPNLDEHTGPIRDSNCQDCQNCQRSPRLAMPFTHLSS